MDYEITEHHNHSHESDNEKVTHVFEDVSYGVEIFGIPNDMYPELSNKINEMWKDDRNRRTDDVFNFYASKIEERSFWFPDEISLYHEIKITCADEVIINRTKNILKPFFEQHMRETLEELNEGVTRVWNKL